MDVPTLLVEVTRAQEAAIAVEAAHATAMLAAETSIWDAAVAWDSATFRDKDAEDWATLVEREAPERMLRAEVENTVVLASTREDTEGFIRKIALLEGELAAEHQASKVSEKEHLEQFEELTLL
jgi:hypothetical protein